VKSNSPIPRIVAHRGSSERHPGNSWAAFEGAVAERADAIECDVQRTRDGMLVIRHDLALRGRLIAELTAAEIDDAEPGLVRLADLLDRARRVEIDLLVELKDLDAAAALAEMVAASPWRGPDRGGSFHGPALAMVKTQASNVRTSLMIGSVVGAEDLVRLSQAYGADGVHPCWEDRAPRPHRLLDRATVGRVREAGIFLTLWHEERESELRALVPLAPDAICTNAPARLRWILEDLARP